MTVTLGNEYQKKKQADAKQDEDTESEESAAATVPVDPSSPSDSEDAPPEIVSSPVTVYVVEKPGESTTEIAKKIKVSSSIITSTRISTPEAVSSRALAFLFHHVRKLRRMRMPWQQAHKIWKKSPEHPLAILSICRALCYLIRFAVAVARKNPLILAPPMKTAHEDGAISPIEMGDVSHLDFIDATCDQDRSSHLMRHPQRERRNAKREERCLQEVSYQVPQCADAPSTHQAYVIEA